MEPNQDSIKGALRTEVRKLRAQLAAALAKIQVEVDTRCTPSDCQWVARVKDLESKLAAARSDAVREFAEWLDGENGEPNDEPFSERILARYLERGVPSARPDDAGRVERVRNRLTADCNLPMRYSLWDDFARAVLASADGAERGGR